MLKGIKTIFIVHVLLVGPAVIGSIFDDILGTGELFKLIGIFIPWVGPMFYRSSREQWNKAKKYRGRYLD